MAKQTAKSEKRDKSEKHQIDAIAILTEDHERVQKMFKEFSKIKDDTEAQRQLVEAACMEIAAHAEIEEEIFYPAARQALEDGDLIEEANVEHAVAERLIGELREMSPEDERYAATFTVLSEYLTHHIEEEEKELFPKLKKAKGLDLEALGQQLQQKKQELQEQELEEVSEPVEDEDSGKAARS